MSDDKTNRADTSDLPTTGQTKREKIREMLSAAENYNTQEIAKLVDTTPAYIWKEKSKLRTEGLMFISQRKKVQVSERKDEVIMVPEDGRRRRSLDSYNYSPHYRFLNVREIDEEGLRTLYTELKDGKKPADIIARYGFHPEVVEKEYQRFLRLNEHSIIGAFQKKIKPLVRSVLNIDLVEKLEKEGYLSEDDFGILIKNKLNEPSVLKRNLEARRNRLNR
jgi:hypothetical protein